MAQQGVLRIPTQIIDPSSRNIIASTSTLQVVVFNKKLLAPEKVRQNGKIFSSLSSKVKRLSPTFDQRKSLSLVPRPGGSKRRF